MAANKRPTKRQARAAITKRNSQKRLLAEERNARIIDLIRGGMSQSAAGRTEGLSRSQSSAVVKQYRVELRQASLLPYLDQKLEQADRMRSLYELSMDSFHRSRQPQVEEIKELEQELAEVPDLDDDGSQKIGPDGKPLTKQAMVTVKQRVTIKKLPANGDASLIRAAIDATSKYCGIMGLVEANKTINKNTQVNIGQIVGQQAFIDLLEAADLTDEELIALDRVNTKLAKLGQARTLPIVMDAAIGQSDRTGTTDRTPIGSQDSSGAS